MSEPTAWSLGDLPVPEVLRVEQACRRFERAWKQWRTGPRPDVGQALGDAAGGFRAVLLVELLQLDLDFRRQAGERPTPADFLSRFAGDEALVRRAFEGAVGSSSAADGPATGQWNAAVSVENVAQPFPHPPAGGGAGVHGKHPSAPAVTGYEVLEKLGEGGIGVVHRARDASLRRELAIKVLRDKHRNNTDLMRRFVEEAQVGSQLQHPGVVPVYELGELADRLPYFTMKLVKGEPLDELLKRRNSPGEDLPRWLSVFEQVCQTLAYAHQHSVLHRDLKPRNVVVGAFGEVQVMDWGFAKVLDAGGSDEADPTAAEKLSAIETDRHDAPGHASQHGAVMGTFAYMPPEQARGEVDRLDERTDVFGLGAILCHILTGRPPYTGTPDEVRRKAEAGDLQDAWFRLHGCGAEAELVRIARTCLAAKPAERPRDAGTAAKLVTAYLAGVQERLRKAELERAAAQAKEAEAKAKAAAERRARRVTVGLAGSVLVTLVLLGTGGWWLQRQWAEDDRRRAAAERQEAETAAAVEANLGTATKAAERADDQAAREALKEASGRMAGGGFDALRERADALRRELEFVARLEEIRLKRSAFSGYMIASGWKDAEAAYAEAFRNHQLDPGRLGAAEAGDRIWASTVRERIAAALDDWAVAKRAAQAEGLGWVLEAARRADPDERRALLRDEAVLGDAARLKEIAARPEVADWPPASATALAAALLEAKEPEAAASMLRQVQRRHSGDFWVNEVLVVCLRYSRPPQPGDAVGFARAAAAARPGIAATHNDLGNLLLW
jgi:serine/threonine-protein kinase